jgi:hypothetical protein
MAMTDIADLKKRHDYQRRAGDIFWPLLSLLPISVGIVACLVSKNFLYLVLGIVFAVPSWAWWYRHRYILYLPSRDPVSTEEVLRAHAELRHRRARKVAFANGIILIVVAPLIGIAAAEGPDGAFHLWDNLLGVVIGILTAASGIGAVIWSLYAIPSDRQS